MATSVLGNSRAPRKQLSDQLDRLDVILDGLADALNESVADAVRDVVGQAVQEAVTSTLREVLGSPELLRAALAAHGLPTAGPVLPAQPPESASRPSLHHRLGGAARRGGDQVRQAAGRAWLWSLRQLRAGLGWLKAAGTGCATAARLAWRFRAPCAVAAAAGLLVGVGAYVAGPLVASLGCGLGGSALAAAGLAVQRVGQLLRSPTAA